MTDGASNSCGTTGDASSGGTSPSREWAKDTEDSDSSSISTGGTGKMQ